MFEIELFTSIKMDLALNNLQCFICHKNQTKHTPTHTRTYKYIYVCVCVCMCATRYIYVQKIVYINIYTKHYIYKYVYIITELVVTKSLCGVVSNQVQYNMENAQYLG